MIEPTLALQTAIRILLVGKQDVTKLVPADHIRSGSTRPDKKPCIIMSDGNTALHGQDYSSQRTAWVYLDLHIWTLDAGQDAAKKIAGVVTAALDKWNLAIEGGYCDHFKVTASRFPRDPNPAYGHGVLSVEALIRWIV
ncbi:tail completion protein gp17 [Agrobacterium cavarae]|uniref:tail completion protein gp17 n=1 Tax=Agrobacterium cavarae TaxID=2528239 RepID=UPI003FD62299